MKCDEKRISGGRKLLVMGMVAVVAVASITLVVTKYNSEHEILIVVTGSMDAGETDNPISTIPVNSMISLRYLTEDDLQSVKVGDVLGYSYGDKTIVHRVIAIDWANETFTFKGDANTSTETVQFSKVVGIVTDVYPEAGNLITFLRNGPVYVIAELICLFVMISCVREILRVIKEEETEAKQ